MIAREDITGLILAGGRGSRMGGTDKGLQPLRGVPMAMHTLMRLDAADRRDADQRQSQPRRLRVVRGAGGHRLPCLILRARWPA